ncbi:pheromone-processing carboxypeptidase KEX1-like [Micropterus salmoides]|uniref:pheromone-processing carboxypeptidase KEX1-like n=1 Tax=Micropterus salmoides TaxID=27706 RepID=UPI0018EDBDA8|nr:pheromone-processing carboxypeptidase KEX1-like [Micropterus salmoides]
MARTQIWTLRTRIVGQIRVCSREQPSGHAVVDSDGEEGKSNNEPERQSLDDHTDRYSDGTDASLDSDFEHPLDGHTDDDDDGGDDEDDNGPTSDSEHMVNDDMMRSPLYRGASVTLGQTILLLMAFAGTVGLTQDGLQKLLQILILVLPPDCHLPATKSLQKTIQNWEICFS